MGQDDTLQGVGHLQNCLSNKVFKAYRKLGTMFAFGHLQFVADPFKLNHWSLLLMNAQIHRKQIVILVLAMALAAASYWIPLPQQSEIYKTSSIVREPVSSAAIVREPVSSAAPIPTITYTSEPATIWRFPVAIQAPQTPVQTASATDKPQPGSLLPATEFMDQRDFVNGSNLPAVNSQLLPIKELNYDLKR